MNIELRRIRHRPDTIDGQIWIDGLKVCDCAENAHHCLPPGRHQVIVRKCKFRGRKMPCVLISEQHQPPCAICSKSGCVGINSTPHKGGEGGDLLFCPMLCPGNGVYHRIDGAILVGRYAAPGCLAHPKSTFGTLYERIRKNAARGNDINLIISNQETKHSQTQSG